jgi:hypothetical protein
MKKYFRYIFVTSGKTFLCNRRLESVINLSIKGNIQESLFKVILLPVEIKTMIFKCVFATWLRQ